MEAVSPARNAGSTDALSALKAYSSALLAKRATLATRYDMLRTKAIALADASSIPVPVVLTQGADGVVPRTHPHLPIMTITGFGTEYALCDVETSWLQNVHPDLEKAYRELGDALVQIGREQEALEIAQIQCHALEVEVAALTQAISHILRTFLMLQRDPNTDRANERENILSVTRDILAPGAP